MDGIVALGGELMSLVKKPENFISFVWPLSEPDFSCRFQEPALLTI
jgi:hypothetical protein